VLYELHVGGFTRLHPEVPTALRGTYAGLAHPAAVGHLVDLGVTTVELLPVHHRVTEPSVAARGLTNYWGYNTLGFFAPDSRFAASGDRGEQVAEFRGMVDALHAAGLEVVLDVVYNHTAEGGADGPTLSFRGIDNLGYYRVRPDDPARYTDVTGCGNTLDVRQPQVLRLVLDSMRYWVLEMGVDGFRVDLASALTRGERYVDPYGAFLGAVAQDPVLSRTRLIAEPWDLGDGGYQVGRFGPPWSEWNDRFRDTARDLWAGTPVRLGDVGLRLSGSADLYQHDGRGPSASVNLVTAHDGFTLRDLVSYREKHNEANGEDNRDGESSNRSSNHGGEGPTDDPEVAALRRRQVRNLLATLLLSAGVPMLLGGDEMGRTQGGNNNAYCQDNAVSWVDWDLDDHDRRLLGYVRRLLALRAATPALRPATFFVGTPTGPGHVVSDLAWFRADGQLMTPADWQSPRRTTLGMYLDGDQPHRLDEAGVPMTGESYLVVVHAGQNDREVRLPAAPWARSYEVVLDTAEEAGFVPGGRTLPAGSALATTARSVVVLRVHR